jgi:hypothetical protein
MRLSLSLPAALLGLASFVAASNVIDLDTANFDKYVGGAKGALVELWVLHGYSRLELIVATHHGVVTARTVCNFLRSGYELGLTSSRTSIRTAGRRLPICKPLLYVTLSTLMTRTRSSSPRLMPMDLVENLVIDTVSKDSQVWPALDILKISELTNQP